MLDLKKRHPGAVRLWNGIPRHVSSLGPFQTGLKKALALVLQRIRASVGKEASCLHQQVFSSSASNLITQHRFTFEPVTGKEHFEPKPIVSQPPRALTHLQTIAKVEEFREQM